MHTDGSSGSHGPSSPSSGASPWQASTDHKSVTGTSDSEHTCANLPRTPRGVGVRCRRSPRAGTARGDGLTAIDLYGSPRDELLALVAQYGDRLPLDRAAALLAAEEQPGVEVSAILASLDELARGLRLPP